jgi:ubiquinone/menaquinone biosynthesis C-methylase UbiE
VTVEDIMRQYLRDPADATPLSEFRTAEGYVRFQGGHEYPRVGNSPVLIDEAQSVFRIVDVEAMKPITQSRSYRDPRSIKNFVRQRVLPQLVRDPGQSERYARMAAETRGAPVLVLGAGHKMAYYQESFSPSPVLVTDVHAQFGVDLVVDAHQIPFSDSTFGLVIADGVLEHVARPWRVAAEMERVTITGGLVHISTPFCFAWHAYPYDFHRFTPTGLRFLLPHCDMVRLDIVHGRATTLGLFANEFVVGTFDSRKSRALAVALSRFSFGWLKYLDIIGSRVTSRRVAAATALAITGRKDGRPRRDGEMLSDVAGWASDRANA